MIIPRRIDGELNLVDIRISQAAAWQDSFAYNEITRPLLPGWTRARLIIRPEFDHPTVLRDLKSDGVAPEIIVDDAAYCELAFNVARTVCQAFPVGTWKQVLLFEYPDVNVDSFEAWRGDFIVEPGLLP